ncbi:flagellar biosynthesis regulator FlaF [Tropicimonas sp. S265A]|uniref:flagellar biosynthesis regulator FlaF n=1 Tax=Tropicimonas sp. S265A TaxID=3415134 RepID=UPI003C7DB814
MNTQAAAISYYSNSTRSVGTRHSNEYAVVSHITQKLRAAEEHKASNFPHFVEMLTLNRKLWQNFGADVAEPDNQLPKSLKAKIFYLAEFVDQHTRLVLKGTESAIDLIEINDTILQGLRNQGGPS